MRRAASLSLILMVCAALIPVSGRAFASGRIDPLSKTDAVRVRVGGKLKTYHRATSNDPVEFRIRGPVQIRVLSRLLFDGDPPRREFRYRLRMEIDGTELRTLRQKGSVSKRAFLASGGLVGSLEKSIVRIPHGTHTVRVFPEEEGVEVGLRLFHGDGKPSTVNWISFAPETYEKAVRLHTGDTETVYYRFSAEKPVTLFLRGPLRMKVRTRIDFGQEQGYYQKYVIKTMIDGEHYRNFSLKGRASHTSTYPDLPEITPGVGRDIEIQVPGGRHAVTISLDCTTAGSAALRILIPEKAVKNDR